MEMILEEYCANEMKKLKQICYPLLIKIGGISEKDYDDFYSIALDALADSALRYDETKKCQFNTFLIGNIRRKFNTEIRDRNRAKRIPAKKLESTSNLVTEDGVELGETIPSKFDTYETACEYLFEEYVKNISEKDAADVLGDGWTVPVIAHIFSFKKF